MSLLRLFWSGISLLAGGTAPPDAKPHFLLVHANGLAMGQCPTTDVASSAGARRKTKRLALSEFLKVKALSNTPRADGWGSLRR